MMDMDDLSPYTIDAAIADALDQLEQTPVPDPSPAVQHWIWTGTRLVRASPEAVERRRQRAVLEQAELYLALERCKARRQRRWQAYERVAGCLVAPLRSLADRWRAER
jgi:hypothetical protein